jgi:putative transposase
MPIVNGVTRQLRNEEIGGIYHVIARGNDGQAIVADDADRKLWLTYLARSVRRYAWKCLTYCTYCLMTNHFHLVVQIPRGGLSRGMQELNAGYARSFNRRHGRTGHLFRNHFYSDQFERDSHLLETCRYVVLNPVRAGIRAHPADWHWSSYRSCAGLAPPEPFLAHREVLGLFDGEASSYAGFVALGIETD